MNFKNHYGSVAIITDGPIIIGQFSGNINARLVNDFAAGLKKHICDLAENRGHTLVIQQIYMQLPQMLSTVLSAY